MSSSEGSATAVKNSVTTSFDVQHSTMSPVLPFDVIALIIDVVGENEDTNLLKKLALVSHSFLQICSKHLFATVVLHDAVPTHLLASSKKGFVKLLKSRPDVVKYIRKFIYNGHWHQQRSSTLTHPFKFPPKNFSSPSKLRTFIGKNWTLP